MRILSTNPLFKSDFPGSLHTRWLCSLVAMALLFAIPVVGAGVASAQEVEPPQTTARPAIGLDRRFGTQRPRTRLQHTEEHDPLFSGMRRRQNSLAPKSDSFNTSRKDDLDEPGSHRELNQAPTRFENESDQDDIALESSRPGLDRVFVPLQPPAEFDRNETLSGKAIATPPRGSFSKLSPNTLRSLAPVSEEGLQLGLVSDDGGSIAEILLHYSLNSEGELGPVYEDLFQHLSADTRLQVCCTSAKSMQAFVSRWGDLAIGPGREVHVINVNRPITVWARDRRICRQGADGRPGPCFIPTPHSTYDPEKQNDLVLPSLLWSTGLVPNVSLTAFHLEGGNVVSNRKHVFVGVNALADNAQRFPSEEGLFAELTRLFGRPAIAIKTHEGDVPWIHTDMYITPIDTRTVLVASPAEGCRLLPGQTHIQVANRARWSDVPFDQIEINSPKQRQFDDVARQLTDLGYRVIRMPALINVEKDWMVTYNNVLMDYQQGQRVVLMPHYNIPELDEEATRIYTALGFEVRPINVSNVFHLGGAIRCLANVTNRRPWEERLNSRVPGGRGELKLYEFDAATGRTTPARRTGFEP